MIERENGLSNDTIRKRCKKLGIETRNRIDSINACQGHIYHLSGEEHWRRKDVDSSNRLAAKHSARMKENNPSHNKESKEKICSSLAKTLKSNPTFHENLFIEFFKSAGIDFEHQKIVGNYIADFAIGSLLIELDGRGHSSRKTTDRIRDKALNDLGFDVVRVDQDSLFNKRAKNPSFKPNKLIGIIEGRVYGMDITRSLVPIKCKYRVIVREAYTGIERVY